MLVTAVGAGMDLMRAYGDQQKLTAIAALACQYSTRPSVISTAYPSASNGDTGSLTNFQAEVSSFVTTALHSQFPSTSPSYNLTPVLSGRPGALSSVSLSSSVSTTLMQIAGYKTMAIGATANCYSSTALPQVNNNNTLVTENFAAGGSGVSFRKPNGTLGVVDGNPENIPVNNTFPAAPGFTGSTAAQWYIMGYCLETDGAGSISSVIPGGGNSAELDCDNGAGSGGNSSISTQVYLEVGNYELRYYYTGRVDYPNYDPVYLCASSKSDLSWANDSVTSSSWAGGAVSGSARTNQINVYLDLPATSGQPPTHTTLDGAQTLAGSNLIDECLYSPPNGSGQNNNAVWVERSIRIYVNTPSYYWLSFAADGHNDSYGGSIANIELCQGTCTGTVQDNFPSASSAYNPYYPGGSVYGTGSTTCSGTVDTTATALPDWRNLVLFNDSFETPQNTQNSGHDTYTSTSSSATVTASTQGVLNYSTGTSGTSASGWPCQPTSGWATAPYNSVVYGTSVGGGSVNTGGAAVAAAGSQYVELAGQEQATETVYGTTYNNSSGPTSRLISRPFLLVPGYYSLSYSYIADFFVSGAPTTTVCGSTPAAAQLTNDYGVVTGTIRFTTQNVNYPAFANVVGAFIANGQLISTPNTATTLNATTSWTNPDTNLADTPPVTTTTTTPTVRPDTISLANYTPSTISSLLNICAYAPSWGAQTVTFEIQKPGLYWLTFSSEMDDNSSIGNGGGIDNVKLTALGSPAMTSPPASPAIVPVGAPQPSSRLAAADGSGSFYIIADPLTFPAPQQ